MVDIMTALATASQAIKLAQDLRGIDRALDAAEYKLKIADLTAALSDIKMALTDAKEELASMHSEVEKLKRQFQRSAETIEVKGFKYNKGQDGQPKGRAYCPVCEQKSGHLFHLTRIAGKDICPNCKAVFHLVTGYPE
jgi:DNA repair exonuclease SbcCD ATPase subunit